MISHRAPFALRSRRVATPAGLVAATLLVKEGAIESVTATNDIPSNYHLEDVGDMIIMPGLVDTHVHINEPGRTDWEGFETATQSAAAGGVTTLVDMPLNCSPVTTSPEALQEKIAATEGKLWVDCGFYGGVVPGNAGRIQPLIDGGVFGFKAFLIESGIDEFPSVRESDLRLCMPVIARSGLPLLVHCELEGPSGHPLSHAGADAQSRRYAAFQTSRPPEWEHRAVELVVRLAREFQCRVHIVHLSSADSLEIIGKARLEGLPVTVETCPHYLYFIAEEIRDGDTRFKCAPPIRENRNRNRLWDGLEDGAIDFVVSDHSPCPPDMKRLDEGSFTDAWGGVSSLQFGLSAVWGEAKTRGIGIREITEWMSTRPAEFIGLGGKKGKLAPGYDADAVVWDPDASTTLDKSMIRHRHKLTPYEGRTLSGKVMRTYLRGEKVYDDGNISKQPVGEALLSKRNTL